MTSTLRPTSRRRAAAVAALAGLALVTTGCDLFGSDAEADGPDTTVEVSTPATSKPNTTATTAPANTPTLPSTTIPSTPSTTPPSTAAPTTTTGASTGGGLDAVADATVQIFAYGTFADPDAGFYEKAGYGSGFIIDESGLAVTNNHVVGGAGKLEVFVAGEDKPRNAKILGVSECSDLAVIDLEGDGYTPLSWYDGKVSPGLPVYAAGYPLSDPEFTLTSGIVAKAEAIGDTNFASVEHVIEHDAAIQPGNSGGPLVTADGEVVGIDYATWTRTNTDQFYAIDAQDAQAIIAELTAGNDVDSLGINGHIIFSEDGMDSGLWVSGVTAGSPADEAGVEPGDIITRLAGVAVGRDGTMADYCDVVRTHDADDTIDVEVVRQATGELLTGQFNGEFLTAAFSFVDELADQTTDGVAYSEYVYVTDDSETLMVAVPVEWADIDGAAIDIGGVSSPSLTASPSVIDFQNRWDVPGVQFVASAALVDYTEDELLDLAAGSGECASAGRFDYGDGYWFGRYEFFEDCGGTGANAVVVAAFADDNSYGVLVAVQVVSDADLEALDEVLNSFDVVA